MESVGHLLDGFATALTPENLLFVFIGVFIGTLVGVLPGLGSPATLAILLPITINLPPATGLIMMAGIYYGTKYGGSTTSILLNVPGESSSVVTTLDGYQMAKQGRAGAALGIAAIASFVAGTLGVVGLTLLALPVARLALSFGPPEYFALMTLGLVSVVFLAGKSLTKGLISAVLGLLLATIGADIVSGQNRFTFGNIALLDGIEFIALSIGVFALAEVFLSVEKPIAGALVQAPGRLRDLLPTRQDLKDSRFAMAQGSVVGFLIGVLPGAGATVASFLAYTIERRFSKHPEKFGTGVVEGVAAPEAANNSETGGAMIPLLTFGIPGSGSTAIMLGILIIYGVQPGPLLFPEHPEIVWPVIASMYIGNVALLVLNLPLAPMWASILRLPSYVIYPAIVLLSVIGVYSVHRSVFDLWLMLAFGVLGYLMRKVDIPAAPLVLAFVLGPLAEGAFRRSLIISQNDPSIFVTRPVALVLLVLAALLLVAPFFGRAKQLRREVIEEEEP
jgi:putative tricarboxylic transport membrane protein